MEVTGSSRTEFLCSTPADVPASKPSATGVDDSRCSRASTRKKKKSRPRVTAPQPSPRRQRVPFLARVSVSFCVLACAWLASLSVQSSGVLATSKTLNSHERARLRRYAQDKRDVVDSFEAVIANNKDNDEDVGWGTWSGEPALSQRMDDEDDDDPIVLPGPPPTLPPTLAPKTRVSAQGPITTHRIQI